MVIDYEETVFSGHKGYCTHEYTTVKAVCIRCVKAQVRQKFSMQRRGGHGIPPLAKVRLIANCSWERELFFFFKCMQPVLDKLPSSEGHTFNSI